MENLVFLKGDCLEVLKDLSANSIDLVIADLPYGCLIQEKGSTPFGRNTKGPANSGCLWDIPIDLNLFWKEIERVLKSPKSPVLMFCTTKFGIDLINSKPKWFRYDLVWNKERGTSFLTANKMPLRCHEMIYVFSKGGSYYNRIDIEGDFKGWKAQKREGQTQRAVPIAGEGNWECAENTGTRCITSVVSMKKGKHTKDTHPTEKPIELYKFLIERYCPPGGTVLDPTAGSFNSCFASYEIGRKAIGIEKESSFFDKACVKRDTLLNPTE